MRRTVARGCGVSAARGGEGAGIRMDCLAVASRPFVSLVFQSNFGALRGAVLIRFKPSGSNSIAGQLLIALLRVARDSDRADHLAIVIADQHSSALGENPVAGCADDV